MTSRAQDCSTAKPHGRGRPPQDLCNRGGQAPRIGALRRFSHVPRLQSALRSRDSSGPKPGLYIATLTTCMTKHGSDIEDNGKGPHKTSPNRCGRSSARETALEVQGMNEVPPGGMGLSTTDWRRWPGDCRPRNAPEVQRERESLWPIFRLVYLPCLDCAPRLCDARVSDLGTI